MTSPRPVHAPLVHLATLFQYGGISFIAGAVNHGFFSGERSLLTAVIGVLSYLVGGALARRAQPDTAQSWSDLLGVGVLAAVGLGFFTGGLQHFPDSPARSAWVVPLGFLMSFAAFWWTLPRESGQGRRMVPYGVAAGAALTIGCVLAWKLLGSSGLGHDHAAHSHDHGSSAVVQAPAPQASGAPVREIRIEMDDTMRFTPGTFEVTAGVPVRLVVVNRGKVRHELVIGTAAELDHHALEMRKSPGNHHHGDRAIQVEPGATRTVNWVFQPGVELGMACFEPGHFEAGMRGLVKVLPQS